jgi:hypothetical protein
MEDLNLNLDSLDNQDATTASILQDLNILDPSKVENNNELNKKQNVDGSDSTGNKPAEEPVSSEEILGELLPNNPESVAADKKEDIDKNLPPTNVGASNSKIFQLAKALKEEGVLSTADDDEIKELKDYSSLVKLIAKEVDNRLDSTQKRINTALSNGIEPDQIKVYEQALNNLNNINDDIIESDADNSIALRKELIMRDFLNRGFNENRARAEVEKSFKAGTDIEDAKEALQSNIEFYGNQYSSLIEEAKKNVDSYKNKIKEEEELLHKNILEDENLYNKFNVSKDVREKIFNTITKPVYKDEDGNLYTSFTKYIKDNREDYMKTVGLLFTMTDGFKNLEKLTKININKAKTKALQDLEKSLNNSNADIFNNGSLSYYSGVDGNIKSNGKPLTLA